jgi:type I restriction enzyme M protein
MSQKINQKKLFKPLWKACDTFWGIRSFSIQDYILTMLFLKYISDVNKRKREEYLEKIQWRSSSAPIEL